MVNDKKFQVEIFNFPSVSSTQKWVLNDSRIDKLLNENPSEKLTKKNFFILTWILYIYVIPFSRVICYYLKQFFIGGYKNKKTITSLILHSGRGYDTNNIQKIFQINTNEMYLIYAFSLTDYMKYEKLSIFTLLRNLAIAIADYKSVLTMKFPDEIIGILYGNTANISVFTYLLSFFQQLKEKHPGCTVYSAGAILPSHAAILSEHITINIYHGLMDKINLSTFPEYDSVCVYSYDERKYLIDAGIKSKVLTYPMMKAESRKNISIFFMPAIASNEIDWSAFSESFLSLTKLFKTFDYDVYIKVHPLAKASKKFSKEYNLQPYNWDEIFDLSNFKYVDGSDGTSIINKLKPNFVISWGSTALCEALNMGLIPITLWDTRWDSSESVYPINKRALLWPSEMEVIQDLLDDNSKYDNVVEMLKTR
jgi:hypothetical protein